ncbi:hypothetical protein BSNK01_00500 [Bacillaceae bacterium]
MKIRGKIVKKRPYVDIEEKDINCITFVDVEDGIDVNGDKIKIIPILSDDSKIPQQIGESVEVDGKIEFKKIVTPSGKRNLSPVPVVRLLS